MWAQTLVAFCFLISSIQFADAAEIKVSYTEDSYSVRQPHVIFVCDKKSVELPRKTSIESIVSNPEKTIWAVNFHETSNYNGAEVAICDKSKVIIIDDIYNQIEEELLERKLITRKDWDRITLRVTKVKGNVLFCSFDAVNAANNESSVKSFSILYDPISSRIRLEN